MRNPGLPGQLWCIITILLGVVLVACDLQLGGYLADAYLSVPASLGDDVTPFTITILVIGIVLALGGVVVLILASRRTTEEG